MNIGILLRVEKSGGSLLRIKHTTEVAENLNLMVCSFCRLMILPIMKA